MTDSIPRSYQAAAAYLGAKTDRPDNAWIGGVATEQLSRALYRYVKSQLGIAS